LPAGDLKRALAEVKTYDITVIGRGAGPGGKPRRHERRAKQEPEVALAVPGRWLLGADRGEWGGELIFLNRKHRQHVVHDGNIKALHRLGNRIVALGGLGHLFFTRGVAYEVIAGRGGEWSLRPWRVLPGAPIASPSRPTARG
jgi:hypothetical protein